MNHEVLDHKWRLRKALLQGEKRLIFKSTKETDEEVVFPIWEEMLHNIFVAENSCHCDSADCFMKKEKKSQLEMGKKCGIFSYNAFLELCKSNIRKAKKLL